MIVARATFDPDPLKQAQISGSWSARLRRATARQLSRFATHAASTADLALAALVSEEAERAQLSAEERQSILSLLDGIPLRVEVAGIAETLAKIILEAELARREAEAASLGRELDPVERLSIARG